MDIKLNERQRKALADMCFDISKGLALSGVGSSVIFHFSNILVLIAAAIFATWFVTIGLKLLEERAL